MDSITIAVIAHDNKKDEMVDFIIKRLDFFNQPNVYTVATGTTGGRIEAAGVTKVTKYSSGPLGGDAEIAALVVQKKIDAVIFFKDPLGKHPHDPDISMLSRLCDVHNIALATNSSTAEYIIDNFKK